MSLLAQTLGFLRGSGELTYKRDEPKTDPQTMSIMASIAHNESGGEKDPYSLRKPDGTGNGEDIGKYQVNTSELASWGKQILGKDVTPDQFSSDPNLQEEYMQKKVDMLRKDGVSPQEIFALHRGGLTHYADPAVRQDKVAQRQGYVDNAMRYFNVHSAVSELAHAIDPRTQVAAAAEVACDPNSSGFLACLHSKMSASDDLSGGGWSSSTPGTGSGKPADVSIKSVQDYMKRNAPAPTLNTIASSSGNFDINQLMSAMNTAPSKTPTKPQVKTDPKIQVMLDVIGGPATSAPKAVEQKQPGIYLNPFDPVELSYTRPGTQPEQKLSLPPAASYTGFSKSEQVPQQQDFMHEIVGKIMGVFSH